MLLVCLRDGAVADGVRARVAELEAIHGGLAPKPLLSGDDLVAGGLEPGPAFGRILERVYDAQLEGRVANKDQAMELARRLSV
jgi:hypothetical protein